MEILTVSEFINGLKNQLENQYKLIVVEGEVSNLTYSSTGHYYFNLLDENAMLSVALFKMDAFRNPLIKTLKNGDKIICTGPISVYAKRGSFQLVVKQLFPAGKGNLQVEFELLKQKLTAEGLFDISSKKKIPDFPSKIAVITSESGAALVDFTNIFKRRSIWMDLTIFPSLVQGDTAPQSIIKALKLAESIGQFDVIVITRGGGSMEDLWAFNNEELVRTMAKCKTPIISAIGHEVDFTLCDFVADLRAETPSAAAELLTAPQVRIKERMLLANKSLNNLLKITHSDLLLKLNRYRPENLLRQLQNKINDYNRRLNRCDIRNRLLQLTRIHEKLFLLDEFLMKLTKFIGKQVEFNNFKIETMQAKLKMLSPKLVLERGYSFVQTSSGEVISSSKSFRQLPKFAELKIHFFDGDNNVQKLD